MGSEASSENELLDYEDDLDDRELAKAVATFEEDDNVVQITINEQEQFPSDAEDKDSEFSESEEGELKESRPASESGMETDNPIEDAGPSTSAHGGARPKHYDRRSVEDKLDQVTPTSHATDYGREGNFQRI